MPLLVARYMESINMWLEGILLILFGLVIGFIIGYNAHKLTVIKSKW